MSRVAVIGAGSWGTAFSGLVAANADEVSLWCHSEATANAINETRHNARYLPEYALAPNVRATASLGEALEGADGCVPEVPALVLTKGIEPDTGLVMSEVASSELGRPERIAALSGPNHAEEVCTGAFAASVLAAEDLELAERLRSLVSTPAFRVYVSRDVRGVETCGAVKNVMAIACGICAGLGLGDNTLALIMTRGIAEIGRMVAALGGEPMTCMGLAGMGDLVATCTSEHSRNRRFGEAFVAGRTLDEFEASTHMVVEGARAVVSVRELAQKKGVEVPISDAVWNVIYGGMSVETVTAMLIGRTPTREFYGMGTTTTEGK